MVMILHCKKKYPIIFRFVLGFLLCLGVTLLLTVLDYWYNDFWVIFISVAFGLFALYLFGWVLLLFKKIKPVVIADKSKRNGVKLYQLKYKYANAYASGFGNSKVTIFTTRLLEILDDDEIKAVMLHEEGHHHYNDSLRGTLLALLIGTTIALISTTMTVSLSHSLILSAVLAIPGMWVYLDYSRAKEKRADQYAFRKLENPNLLHDAIVKMIKDTERQL